jgi:hypothetical protein
MRMRHALDAAAMAASTVEAITPGKMLEGLRAATGLDDVVRHSPHRVHKFIATSNASHGVGLEDVVRC